MRTILLVMLLALSACKNKEDAKPAATEEKKAADTAVQPQPAGAAVTSAADYEARATAFTDQVLAVFVDAGTDCDKLAASLSKLADDKRSELEAIQAFEKANPAAEKAFDDKMKSRDKELEEKLGPGFDACAEHAGMKAAIAKLPFGD
jgi:hypothetical protein